jgi:hypothetical protein
MSFRLLLHCPSDKAEKGEKEEAAVEGETNDSENSFALGQMRQV